MSTVPNEPPPGPTGDVPSLHPPSASTVHLADSNPWRDQPANEDTDVVGKHRLETPEPSALDESMTASFLPPPTDHDPPPDISHGRLQEEVLREFDPLASQEEQAAREAWADADAHPPPPPRTPSPPPPPTKDTLPPSPDLPLVPPPAAPSSAFPSLAALARSFSIPTIPRSRPVSFDFAKAVPSPATLSSFASQQQQPQNPDTIAVKGINSPSGSGTESPRHRTGDGTTDGKDREKEQPFDFQKFLDQMKLKAAEPVARYLRSFLSNFAKRTFTVNDQVKIINDFLHFIAGRMREADVWRNASDTEFDNAMEGMEKLVMNRLYDFTFTPQIVRAVPHRPVTADDLERDRVLSQRIALFGWIEEKHLDIPEGEGGKGFLMFAQQELLKINHYKAPRDKLICILNCCKVVFGLIRHFQKEEGADAFVPILIFVVLKANPEHLLSNVEFINRFRNPEKLQSEAGYYLSSLMGAVSFIETMDHTSVSNITQQEFEKNVEEAIQALPNSPPLTPATSAPSTPRKKLAALSGPPNPPISPHAGEESAQPLSLPAPSQTLGDDARRILQKTGDTISKPLNAIGRIFSEALDNAEGKLTYLPGPFAPMELGREGRLQNSAEQQSSVAHWAHPDQVQQYAQGTGSEVPQTPADSGVYNAPVQTPYKPRVRRGTSPTFFQPSGSPQFSPEDTPTRHGVNHPYTNQSLTMGPSQPLYSQAVQPRVQSLAESNSLPQSQHVSRTPTPSLDFAGLQAQIDVAHDQAAVAARETLTQIFPSMDTEVVEWVLEANEGDLGKSIEALLEMSTGS